MRKRKGVAVLCAVILCITTATCSKPVPKPEMNNGANIAPLPPAALPSGILRTEGVNMLTGLPEKESEKGKRPIAVMVDNVRAALPQRGIGEADIIYEMVTESGITRLMALFSDSSAMPQTGPVRSARDQHVKLMLPLNTSFLHIGSSTYASEILETYRYGSYSINGLYQPGALKLDYERTHNTDIEHCWFTDGELFSTAAQEYSLNLNNDCKYSAFKFSKEPRVPAGESAHSVTVRFSSYVTSEFSYSEQTMLYSKEQFGLPHIDENTGEAVSFDNVLILFTDITKYPDGVLANVRYTFGGVGYYFSKGFAEQVRWTKTADNAPLLILSADGTEKHVEINTGKSYVAMVDLSMYEHFKIMPQEAVQTSSQLLEIDKSEPASQNAQE